MEFLNTFNASCAPNQFFGINQQTPFANQFNNPCNSIYTSVSLTVKNVFLKND